MVKISTAISFVLIIIVIAVYVFFKMDKTAEPEFLFTEQQVNFPTDKIVATWLWESPYDMTESQMQEYVNNASANGFNTIYLDVASYLDIREQADKSTVETNMNIFRKRLEKFIELTHTKNIKIEGLAGGTRWADDTHRYIPPLFVNFVHDFNSSSNYDLSGMHFDIEVWNNDSFDSNREQKLLEYIEMIDRLVKLNNELNTTHTTDIHLSFDISYWLDNQNGNIPQITWNGTENYPFFHIADILGKTPTQNYLIIMAYRNYTDGKDGSARLSKEELDYIRDNKLNLQAIIAIETGNTPESKITYYGQDKNSVRIATNELHDAYIEFPQFAGVAIHSLRSYLELK